ncbi:L-rhamnose mutarotase [Pedobacter frigiditerrae]|uniref:L-rhamnose mutarotase n=1 Tax=Pedobacter frigiditerrae TaxID=2530452 RepID=A0A4V2MHW2_9SPHI|nr:L-rhamnose mutarotase [Pedobacter frigiditerrae]TCC87946.1 L-rhamnose mutarotase [Pedobacter frigiditerrae]
MKNFKTAIPLFILLLFFIACSQTSENNVVNVKRFGAVTGLKQEQIAYYKKLHAAVWPAVQKKITACNIQNYSIYLKEIEGKQYLFSYFEYTGNDFNNDMKKMAADTTTQRWWKETAPTQIPLPDAASKGETWSSMEEVSHQN